MYSVARFTAHGMVQILLTKRQDLHIQGWIERGDIQAIAVPFGKTTQYQLTQEQQAQTIAYWKINYISYQPCEQCPHIAQGEQ